MSEVVLIVRNFNYMNVIHCLWHVTYVQIIPNPFKNIYLDKAEVIANIL